MTFVIVLFQNFKFMGKRQIENLHPIARYGYSCTRSTVPFSGACALLLEAGQPINGREPLHKCHSYMMLKYAIATKKLQFILTQLGFSQTI